jgi:hypothetical protein
LSCFDSVERMHQEVTARAPNASSKHRLRTM